jgi:lipopolysaccharide export system permease protein
LLLGILGVSLLMLSGLLFELADWLIVKKVAVSTILQLVLYRLPDTTIAALPIAILFAALVALGRMARDNELTVIAGGGMSLSRVMLPLLLIAFLLSGGAYFTGERVVPWANHQFENIVRRIIFQEATPDIQEGTFFRGQDNTVFFIRRLDRKSYLMSDIMIFQPTDGTYPAIITAKRASYRGGVWYLEEGISREMDDDGFVTNEARFAQLEVRMPAEAGKFFGDQKTTAEMNRSELAQNIRLFGKSGIDIRPFLVDYHLKLAMPFANFFFVLLGVPMALFSLRLPRHSRFLGIGVSAALALSYYVVTPFCRSLGVNGVLAPIAAAWLPSVAFALVGIFFFVRMEKV